LGENAEYGQRRDYAADGEIALVLDGRRVAGVAVGDLLR